MTIKRALTFLAISLLPVLGSAQVNRDFSGKWVVDVDKMLEVDPTWDGELTSEMWVTAGFPDGRFRFWRSPDQTHWYDPSGETTRIQLEEGEGLAKSHWNDDELVARITIPGTGHAFTRVFYREGQWLVLEDRGRTTDRWTLTYFVKS